MAWEGEGGRGGLQGPGDQLPPPGGGEPRRLGGSGHGDGGEDRWLPLTLIIG